MVFKILNREDSYSIENLVEYNEWIKESQLKFIEFQIEILK